MKVKGIDWVSIHRQVENLVWDWQVDRKGKEDRWFVFENVVTDPAFEDDSILIHIRSMGLWIERLVLIANESDKVHFSSHMGMITNKEAASWLKMRIHTGIEKLKGTE